MAYWADRVAALEDRNHREAASTAGDVIEGLEKARSKINRDIERWFTRFAVNNQVSLQEAKRLLDARELKELQWDVQEYIKYGRENAVSGEWMKELENASARQHISRLSALELSIRQEIEKAHSGENKAISKLLDGVYREQYYHIGYEVQKRFGIGWSYGRVDEKALEKLLQNPWAADGKNFSRRIWDGRDKMVRELTSQLTQIAVQGKSVDDAIKQMTGFVDSKVKNAEYAASRLVMTEQAFIASAATKDSFKNLGVKQYEIVATLDSHTSEICQELDGQVFEMKDYNAGVTAPPFHPNCRTVTAPFFKDDFLTDYRVARDEHGKLYKIPADYSYKKWKSVFVDQRVSPKRAGLLALDLQMFSSVNKNNVEVQHKERAADYDDLENEEYNANKSAEPVLQTEQVKAKIKVGTLKLDLQMFAREKAIKNQTSNQLRKGIKSYREQIEYHKKKLSNPESIYENWNTYNDEMKRSYLKHWEKEISNFEKGIRERTEELELRGELDE